MGRKSKKKRQKLKYTKEEFQNIICEQCKLCAPGTDPVYCYEGVYKKNPKLFTKTIFRNLIEIKRWLINVGRANPALCSDEDLKYIFTMSFCGSNFCGEKTVRGQTCDRLLECVSSFKKQLSAPGSNVYPLADYRGRSKKKNRKNKKAKKNRYVPQPYPTFFCNERMEPEVRRVVDAYYAKQQDKDSKSARDSKEHDGGQNEGGES